ncbi:MAG TPA: glycosyltransferase family 4 protein [Vicinamibacterales bacterium]|nr:glycosyltransferase family 4 protein [Vicinamibacterales bacterium]
MRVVQLGAYPPPHGGVQTHVAALHAYLRRRGIASSVISLIRSTRRDGEGVFYPTTAAGVLRLLCRVPADILHLHVGGRLGPRLLGLAAVCSLLPRRAVVLTLHSGGYPTFEAGRRAHPRTLRGAVLRRLDAVIAVNGEIADVFRRLGIAERRIRVIAPYAPVAPPADAALPPALERFFAAHAPVLTTVGGLEPEYDIEVQLRAFAALRAQRPQAGLLVVGGGSLEADLRRQIAAMRGNGDILLCGDLAHAVTLQVIARSGVLLRTTRYDGDSIAIREALQLGVRVVATDNGMRPEGVVLVPAADPDALRAAIERALAAPPPAPRPVAADGGPLGEVLALYESLRSRRSLGTVRPLPSGAA